MLVKCCTSLSTSMKICTGVGVCWTHPPDKCCQCGNLQMKLRGGYSHIMLYTPPPSPSSNHQVSGDTIQLILSPALIIVTCTSVNFQMGKTRKHVTIKLFNDLMQLYLILKHLSTKLIQQSLKSSVRLVLDEQIQKSWICNFLWKTFVMLTTGNSNGRNSCFQL